MQAIPARTIEEMRLRRQVDVQNQMYTTVKTTYTQAELSEAGTAADVTILDSAIAPCRRPRTPRPA